MKTTKKLIVHIVLSLIVVAAICIAGWRGNQGVHNTPNGTVFCKDSIKVVLNTDGVVTEDDIAFYVTEDGKDAPLLAIAKKHCKE